MLNPINRDAIIAFIEERVERLPPPGPIGYVSLAYVCGYFKVGRRGVRDICHEQKEWQVVDIGGSKRRVDEFVLVPRKTCGRPASGISGETDRVVSFQLNGKHAEGCNNRMAGLVAGVGYSEK